MTKKKAIIIIVLLLIILAASLFFFIKTENSAVTAFSLLGVMASGLLIIIFSLFMLARHELTLKQELVLYNYVLIFMPLLSILYIIWAVLTGREDTPLEAVLSVIWMLPSLGMMIFKRRELKKELFKLSELEVEDESNDTENAATNKVD